MKFTQNQSGIMQRFGRKAIISATVAATIATGIFSYPYIKTAVQKYSAGSLLRQTNEAVTDLSQTLSLADRTLEDNLFIMTGDGEIQPMHSELNDSRYKLGSLQRTLNEAEKEFDSKRYTEVKKCLNPGRNEDSQVSPRQIAKTETEEIKTRVINYCTEKRSSRDAVMRGEFLLNARLKKPRPGYAELEPDIEEIPAEFRTFIPVKTPELEERLSRYPPELYNSLGVALIEHEDELNHAREFGRTEEVKNKAKMFFDAARGAYIQVRPENDKLVWYRPNKHDGKYSQEDYKQLLATQKKAIDDLQAGDRALASLDDLDRTMHSPYFVYVSEHVTKDKKFHHSRTDDDGDMESYHTQGYEYFIRVRRVDSSGESGRLERLGEKDTHMTWPFGGMFEGWDYAQNEEVNWVREYRPLHDDKVYSGWRSNLKPQIGNCSRKR